MRVYAGHLLESGASGPAQPSHTDVLAAEAAAVRRQAGGHAPASVLVTLDADGALLLLDRANPPEVLELSLPRPGAAPALPLPPAAGGRAGRGRLRGSAGRGPQADGRVRARAVGRAVPPVVPVNGRGPARLARACESACVNPLLLGHGRSRADHEEDEGGGWRRLRPGSMGPIGQNEFRLNGCQSCRSRARHPR
eukprot:scaffold9278_cov117-Isochrysis_galbana.AAC.14